MFKSVSKLAKAVAGQCAETHKDIKARKIIEEQKRIIEEQRRLQEEEAELELCMQAERESWAEVRKQEKEDKIYAQTLRPHDFEDARHLMSLERPLSKMEKLYLKSCNHNRRVISFQGEYFLDLLQNHKYVDFSVQHNRSYRVNLPSTEKIRREYGIEPIYGMMLTEDVLHSYERFKSIIEDNIPTEGDRRFIVFYEADYNMYLQFYATYWRKLEKHLNDPNSFDIDTVSQERMLLGSIWNKEHWDILHITGRVERDAIAQILQEVGEGYECIARNPRCYI